MMKLILRANGKGYHLLIVYYVPDVYFRYLLFICSLLSGQFSNFLSFFLFFFFFAVMKSSSLVDLLKHVFLGTQRGFSLRRSHPGVEMLDWR